jgi:ribosomal protein S18 acetylase RimI-like enzyme
MIVRPATQPDIPYVVKTHEASFRGFFMTLLGKPFLAEYYKLVLRFEHGLLLVAEEEGQVIGFVSGFLHPERFYQMMKANKLRFGQHLFLATLTRPALWVKILQRFLSVSRTARRPAQELDVPIGVLSELSSIAVHPEMAAKGVGKQLVLAFLEESWRRGAECVYLTTDADGNEAVNRFYQRLGFLLVGSFEQQGGRRMNKYVFKQFEA